MVINAGFAGDAWSGGDAWRDPELVAALTRFVHEGGAFIGVGEPSACPGGDTFLRLAHVLGVDVDDGSYACHAPWEFEVEKAPPFEVCHEALSRDWLRVGARDARTIDFSRREGAVGGRRNPADDPSPLRPGQRRLAQRL